MTNQAKTVTEISLTHVVAAGAIVVLLLGLIAFHFFGGSNVGAPSAQALANQQWVQQKARETGGDYRRLSLADQQKLYKIEGPMAAFHLRQTAVQSAGTRAPSR